ncbi:MAG: DUF91 domain-containing protein, partial [Chloroflexi bacterium]|nr:DUF91 domain-containing protein [Chloroflexota bacterium]
VVLHLGAEDWHTLATALEETWPGCAAALVAQGMTASRREDYAAAIDSYAAALDRDPSYWLASWLTATAYSAQGNWRAASRSYQQALSSEEAQGYAALHFEFAWCSQRLRDYETAVKHYLSCLEIAPDFQYARNNLGWSLLKLKRFEEALKAFEEAIRQHTPGRYALRNKARALEGLGRYDEAIATLREDTYRGALTKYAEKSIAIIERARARRDAGQLPTEGEPPADEELEEQDQVAEEEAVSPPAARSKERSIAREVWLEELLEEQIHREGAAFGRKLRVYDHTKGYGRQFAIPYLGRIDLLAEDLETGDLVVIELKRAQGHEEVVGQIALYMAWVREHLAEAGQGVHGIICASDVSERLRLAAASVPNLELHEYGLGLHKVS